MITNMSPPRLPPGEDEQSAQLQSSWEEDQVSEAAQNCCVAIKVDAKRYGSNVKAT